MQKNLADLKEAQFKNLKVRPILGAAHSVSWAVRKNSPELMKELNRWIEDKKEAGLFSAMYQKYFIDRRRYLERVTSEYLTSKTGKLSEFDALIKQHAAELNWDWRLLASQVFQESKFRPRRVPGPAGFCNCAGPRKSLASTTLSIRKTTSGVRASF
jgi:membrane-bound lytic murein transglycosylase F